MSFMLNEFVAAEFERIGSAVDWPSAATIPRSRIAAWAISQVVRGTLDVSSRTASNLANLGQETLTMRAGLSLELFANPECGSVLNTELGGPIEADLTLISIDGDARERGFHAGTFSWGRHNRIEGTLAGITNAGTHHPPLYDAVAFDQLGQLVGRLDGRFEHEVLGPGVLYASYVFDLSDPATDLADVKGILEGIAMVSDDSVTPPG